MRPPELYVNTATWTQPADVGPGWAVANAPRPLPGPVTWEGEFRCGVFYAAGPADDAGLAEAWRRLDARGIVLVDNAEVERRVAAYLRENGYETLEQLCLTVAEVAAYMVPPLPYEGG